MIKIRRVFSACTVSICFFSASCTTAPDNDDINQTKIGDQIWTTENLNVDSFRNGDKIMHARTREEWAEACITLGQPAWCYAPDDPDGRKYGKLYNIEAVIDPRGLAPTGWHIPSRFEWQKLETYLGGRDNANRKLRSKTGWAENSNGSNETGFNAYPTPFRSRQGQYYPDPESDAGRSLDHRMANWHTNDGEGFSLWYITTQEDSRKPSHAAGVSVRCVKDNNEDQQEMQLTKQKWAEYYSKIKLTNNDLPRDIKVGAKAGGGIIAYITTPQDPGYVAGEIHGIVVASTDLKKSVWSSYPDSYEKYPKFSSGILSSNIGDGLTNTKKLVGLLGEQCAATTCDNLVLNGYDDWCLPSYIELLMLFRNRRLIGEFDSTKAYWSSSIVNKDASSVPQVWAVFFKGKYGYGIPASNIHSYLGSIRPVRYF